MAAAESNPTCQTPIPPEIIVEILSRLPVKSLLRFKCVCKSWHSLISDPHFAKTHLSLATMDTDYAHHGLFLSSNRPYFEFKTCSLYSVLYEQSEPNNENEIDYSFKYPPRRILCVGSCNGLVCTTVERTIVFLSNPSIEKSKRLPSVEIPNRPFFAIYGFGHGECSDDYKVVGIFFVVGSSGLEAEVQVYRLRTDSWRRIGEFPHGTPRYEDSGKFLNGALHWIVTHRDSSSSWIIFSLDLAGDTYGEVVQPHYRDGKFDVALGVLSGCLCLLCDYDGACADVWVMKEYGTKESWTKLVVIPYSAHPGNYMYSAPLCILKNGEVLLGIRWWRLVLYNPKDGTFRYPTVQNFSMCFDVHPYIESLVWPDADADADSLVQWQHQY